MSKFWKSLVLLGALSLPIHASLAAGIVDLPTDEAGCLAKYSPQIPDVSDLTPDVMCTESEKVPVVREDCRQVYGEIVDVYKKAEQYMKDHCTKATPAIMSYSQNCSADPSSQGCIDQAKNINSTAIQFLEQHKQNIQALIGKLDDAKKTATEGAGEIADGLATNEGIPVMRKDDPTQAAANIGGDSANDAINQIHQGQRSADLRRIIQKVESSISSDNTPVPEVDSPAAYELLQGAEIAKDMKLELTNYNKNIDQQIKDLRGAQSVNGTNADNHNSLTAAGSPAQSVGNDVSGNPGSNTMGNLGALAGPAAGAAGALANRGGGAGLTGGATGSPESVYSQPFGTSTTLGSAAKGANAVDGSARAQIAQNGAEGAAGENGQVVANGTGSSSAKERIAALRDRLARNSSGSSRSGSSADKAAAGAASGGGSNPGSETADGSGRKSRQEGEIVGSSSSFGSGGALETSFSMSGSETDAYVQSMVASFSGELEEGGRGLASGEDAPEILGEESASLFLRTKDTLNRSFKKGLITYGGSTKI